MEGTSPTRATLLVCSLFCGGVLTGALTGAAAVARAQDPYAHLDLFARVLTTIERDYVDGVTDAELVEAAIEGMVGRLDRQSRWLSAAQFQHLQDETEGATTGIGVEVSTGPGGVTVTRVLPGSPALRDGLAPGDHLLAVDGTPVDGLDASAIRDALGGARGEATVLTILREGWDAPRTIETIRDRVHVPSAEGALIDGVAYARLSQFQDGAAFELNQRLGDLARRAGGMRQLRGVVLDVRDNPGGLLTEAVAVCDLFLDDGVIVSTRGRDGTVREEHHATPGGFSTDVPLVVLVNGMSASASEIVAAAIQESGRGTLVGDTTWGKGTVQQVYTNSGTALKLTVGRYYTPSGKPVADRAGRDPDVVVAQGTEPTAQELLEARIAALDLPDDERAQIDALLAQIPQVEPRVRPIPWDVPPAERLADDPQLREALARIPKR